jgi:hypothetical protein
VAPGGSTARVVEGPQLDEDVTRRVDRTGIAGTPDTRIRASGSSNWDRREEQQPEPD